MTDEGAKETIRHFGMAALSVTGGLPKAAPPVMSVLDPPTDIMSAYGCEQIRTYGAGGYGFGTMHRIEGGFATALHVTHLEQIQLVQTVRALEAKYGKCVQYEGTDLHLFGATERPKIEPLNLVEGDPFTIVGCPAGATFPEIHHVEYYLPNDETRGHWVQSVETELGAPKAIVGGNSGGGVYRGHLSHGELADAVSEGHVRAQGDIRNAEAEYDHFGVVSFWSD